MTDYLCAGIMIAAAFLSACSQILLKSSTHDEHKTPLSVYLNVKVILAYAIFALTLFMNIYAYTGIEYKFGSVLLSSAYLFTMLLSVVVLKDRLTWRCVAGNLLLMAGIVVYVFGKN